MATVVCSNVVERGLGKWVGGCVGLGSKGTQTQWFAEQHVMPNVWLGVVPLQSPTPMQQRFGNPR
jgi:hypothetical protein